MVWDCAWSSGRINHEGTAQGPTAGAAGPKVNIAILQRGYNKSAASSDGIWYITDKFRNNTISVIRKCDILQRSYETIQ